MVTASRPKPQYEDYLAALREHLAKHTDAELWEALREAGDISKPFHVFCIRHELHLREMERES